MDILTFLGLYYRVALLIIFYFVVLEISIPRIRTIGWLDHIKICCWKWTYGHSGNGYSVATLSKSYYYRNHHAKFGNNRTILTYLN